MKLFRLLDNIRTGLWFVPVTCVLAGAALSFTTIAIDRRAGFDLVPEALTGGPDAALEILGTVAASMVSLAALVLTITMVVVQLAMGQFSPRIVQRVLQDKPSQLAVGLFVATFAHAMLAMREVRFDGEGSVPGVAILVAYALVLVSIVVLVLYVHHIGQALRVSSLIELVGKDTRTLIDQLYPDHGIERTEPSIVAAPHSGVVNHVGHAELVEVAAAAGCRLEMVPALGDFVPAGAPLFRVQGDPAHLDHAAVASSVVIGLERTLNEDAPYGFRLLVDIAERSLSDSAFEDPTTAVQALDRLHDCLRQLAPRPFPSGLHTDDDGVVRLHLPTMSWDDYVHLAFDEIRQAGAASPQVSRRLSAALSDLRTVALPERISALDEQVRLLRGITTDRLVDDGEAHFALTPDAQGIGPSPASNGDGEQG